MNKTEQTIVQLAETHNDPEEFICALKELTIPPNETGDFFLEVGNILYRFSYFYLALNSWNYGLKYFIRNENKMGESRCYGSLGSVYYDLGDFKKAVKYHEKSLEIAKEVGDKALESACYAGLGNAYCNLGNSKKAIDYYMKSLKIAEKVNGIVEKLKCYTGLGNAYCNLGNLRKAIKYYEISLEIAKEIGDKAGESVCWGNLGIVHHNLGDFRRAIKYHEKSLEIAKEVGDKAGESACYTNLGSAYRNLGDFRRAIKYHEKSLEIAKETDDKNIESRCYGNLGTTHHDLGNFRKAIEYYEKALKIIKRIGDKAGESACYTNLGNAYQDLGDFKKAIKYHEKSLEIAKEIGDRALESVGLTHLGLTYHDLGDFKKAIKYHEKSLEIAKEVGDKAGESRCYGNLGRSFRNLEDFRKAIEYFERSLKIIEEIGDKAGESACYGNLGLTYHDLGDFKKAIKYHEKSLEIAKETDDVELKRIVHLNLGFIYYEPKLDLAYDHCKHSIELSEMISVNLVEEEHKIGFYGRVSDAYQLMIPLCLNIKKEKEAFDYTERSKSRAFLDLLAATEIKPTVEVTSELRSLLDREEKNLAKLRAIQMRHLRLTKVPVEPGEVECIHDTLTQIYNQIEQFDPEYVFIRRGKPLSLAKIQNILSSQKRDTILIEYFITEEKTYIFVISSRDHQLHIESVPLPAETFNQYLKDWRKIAISLDFQNISNYLIKPVSEYLNEDDLIYFVPYGPLHYFPLHALTLSGKPLIKNHSVAYLPSASILPFCQNKGTGRLKTCASFGVSFEKEAEKIADLFNTKAFTGSSATAENLGTCNTDIIHLSCHGLFDDKDPLSSRIQLHDRTLTTRDIFTMQLTTELVTLSACETGYNQTSPGDELIGLTRAFLYAGTPSVIVSLWPVYGPPTQELMTEFYRQLKNSKDKATALQKAQIKLMESEKYSHPYFWAPFILIGNWK